jgi:hypothetical protein
VRFDGDRGDGSFGQADSGVPRREPKAGIRSGGIPARGVPMYPQSTGAPPTGVPPIGTSASGFPPAGVSAGMPSGGMPPMGMPPTGIPPSGVSPQGIPPMGVPGFGGMGQFPVQPMGPMQGTTLGGKIRNNLGAGLKKRGVFQKDGKINNLRGGFFGPKSQNGFPPVSGMPMEGNKNIESKMGYKGAPNMNTGGGSMGSGPFSFLGQGGGLGAPGMPQARQLILEATQAGISANGIASISPDNVFTCIANLPSPNTLMGQGFGTYAAYLVDSKGQTGFLAGVLRPVGNGAYQTQFRSQVPLNHYSRVIITLENPQQLGHVPRGPVILQVKQPGGPSRFLTPIKKTGGSLWGKVSGLFQRKPKTPLLPEGGSAPVDIQPPVNGDLPGGNPPINPMN